MRYFISDLHLFDEGIIGYCGRPFLNVEEMDASLINNFKKKVKPGDEVYILGDILGHRGEGKYIPECELALKEMGIQDPSIKFHLIMGNHDVLSKEKYLEMGFLSSKKISFIDIGGNKTMLTHDPCMVQQRGTLALCGHIHTLFAENYNHDRNTLTINVSVERRGYAPISEDEIIEIIKSKEWKK